MNQPLFNLTGKSVFVAGHRGMVGSAIVRRLAQEPCRVLTVDRRDLDLKDQQAVTRWMEKARPDVVVLAAAKVGGIIANDNAPVDFLYDNLMIQTNVMAAAHAVDVAKLLFLGSSCIYPKYAPQPIREDALLTGPLEPTNEWYAVAKIAGIKLAQAYRRQYRRDFISAMPTNIYGPGDNFDLRLSHVMPGLIRRAVDSKRAGSSRMEIWGSGKPRREFLHVDDLADACIFLLEHYSADEHVNVGFGEDISILELTRLIMTAVAFEAEIVTDQSKPDGTPRKLMDSTKLTALGWKPRIALEEGVRATCAWFLKNERTARLIA